MLSQLQGVLLEKVAESPRGAYFLLDVQGMGFEILTSQRSIAGGAAVGETCLLYTSLVVREDALLLAGFTQRDERDLFNTLQNTSGVGMRVSLALLSALSVSDIAQAIVSGQHATLTAAKGVGSKLAQKITVELKEKMTTWRAAYPVHASRPVDAAQSAIPAAVMDEAEAVLLSLGYQPQEIHRSFQEIARTHADIRAVTSELLLRDALRWLAQCV